MSLEAKITRAEYTGKRERHAVIAVDGLSKQSATALRVIMMSYIPSVAIVATDIATNTSVIHSDYLRIRLGDARIVFSPNMLDNYYGDDIFDFPSFQANNALKFQLKKENKLDSGERVLPVIVGDLEWVPFDGQDVSNMHPKPRFMSPAAKILDLRPGEAVDLVCYAIRGTQRQHARFGVVSSVGYRMETTVDLVEERVTDAERAELFEVCPVNVFGRLPSGKETPDVEDLVIQEDLCINCGKCLKIVGIEDKLSINVDEDRFVFYIDSVGAMDPVDIFKEAVQIYNEREDLQTVSFPTSMPAF